MFWLFVDALVTLPILYAIMATMIEFRFEKKKSFLVIGFAIGVTIFIESWKFFQGVGLENFYSQVWITTGIPSFLCLLYLAKNRDGSFIFLYLTECVIASITTFLAGILAFLLPWKSGFFPFFFHTVLLLCILLICRIIFRKIYTETIKIQGKRWIVYCVLPLICIAVWMMYTSSSTTYLDIENKINLPYAGYIKPRDIPIVMVILVVVFYSVALILIIIIKSQRIEVENREKMTLYFQSMALESHLVDLQDKDDSLQILRHDLRHHLSTLSGLLEKNRIAQSLDYINQLNLNLMQTKHMIFCKNTVINAIISHYFIKAKQEGIQFKVQIQILDNLPVDSMDIGAMLSNILENSLNACIKQENGTESFIDIKFIQHKKQYVLDVSNSFDGLVEFNSDGCPVTKKENHGIGSKSIHAFSRKCNGSIDYCVKNGVFNIRVLFMEENSQNHR